MNVTWPLARARLADPSHKLPVPGHHRWFGSLDASAAGLRDGIETIDLRDLFWLACLADGSIVEVKPSEDGE